MITQDTRHLLIHLERGEMDAVDPSSLEHLAADDLIADLRKEHPVAFLQRQVGSKYEIGLAESVDYKFGIAEARNSPFPLNFIYTSFRKCVLVNAYENSLSGITTASSIKVSLTAGNQGCLTVQMNRGFKLDRFPDGWVVKKVRQRVTKLAEQRLKERGWDFALLFPGGTKP